MSNYPFTPDGFEDKIAEIYALSDADLLLQATAVRDDMPQWVKDNFELTDDQETFLDGQNEFVTDNIGALSAICFINRLDIILRMEPPTTDLSKFLRQENTIATTSEADGTFTAAGTLIIITGYA